MKEIFTNKNVLITGAAGFLGSHLCDRCIDYGMNVFGMDNFITGQSQNLEHLSTNPSFSFIEQDICNYIQIDDNLDYIFHLASPASPIDYLKIPIQTLKASSQGTHNLLGLARVKKAKILVASTSEVYGDPLIHPQNEDYWGNVNPVGPRSMYDEAKRFMEAMTTAYHNAHGLDVRIARIFNTYGPRMRLNDGRVMPAFIGQVLRGEKLTVFGDGTQTRSFCYVEDMIEGLFRLMMSDYTKPLNIGNPQEITIMELALEIIKLTGTKQNITFKSLPINDPKRRKPDILRAKEILDWSPKILRLEGLKRTLNWFSSFDSTRLKSIEYKIFDDYNK